MDFEPFLRMLLAAGVALPVGLDRELRGKPAGLRTHVVVATAAAALGYVSVAAAAGAGNDQTRIAAQVVSGVGFMGAGIIFAAGGRVYGLTTAAALWSAAATGLCVGLGADLLAVALVVVTMLFLWPVDLFMAKTLVARNPEERFVHFVARDWDTVSGAHRALAVTGGSVRELEFDEAHERIMARMTVRCTEPVAATILEQLRGLDGMIFAVVERTSESTGM